MNKIIRGSFLTLLELIIVLIIILFLLQKAFKGYYTKPIQDEKVEKVATDAGINTTNYQSIIKSTKETTQSIMDQRQKEMEQMGN